MENDLSNFSNSLADAVARTEQRVVNVMPNGRRGISGVVSSVDHVLTIAHVLEGDEGLRVLTPDGRTLPAKLVGRDPSTDLALLKVADLKLDPAVTSSEPARVGQLVMLVARPEELMASHGIVSSVTGPVHMGRGMNLERMIRSDAFSGGAVIGVTNDGLARGNALAILPALFDLTNFKELIRLLKLGADALLFISTCLNSIKGANFPYWSTAEFF